MKRITGINQSLLYSFLISLLSLLLIGAQSSLEQEAHATLRIYKKAYTSSGFGIKINEQIVVKNLRNRTWFEVEVPVGKLTIETVSEVRYPTVKQKSFSLEVEAGNLYYLEAIVDYEFWVSSMYLVLREKARAEKDMKRCKQREYELKKVE
ncbi:MAG: hypothetical protein AAGD28_12495 [Bacteroidota bacterium]